MNPDLKEVTLRSCLNLRIPMRDGVKLATHVHLPQGDGPFPVILSRTPYNAIINGMGALEWARHGFAVVYQDARGRFLSQGEWYPWMNEKNDGEDTLSWVAAQPWCDGNIALYGGSYLSATQQAAALSGHPALKCFTPALFASEFYHTSYQGGAFRLGWQLSWALPSGSEAQRQTLQWHLPVRELDMAAVERAVPYWRDVLDHSLPDSWWEKVSMRSHIGSIQAPAFIRTGWFDLFIHDVFDLFNGLRQGGGNAATREFTRIIVGPWPHEINRVTTEEADFGETGKVAALVEEEVAFIRHWTGGNAAGDEAPAAPPLRLFIMGANLWRDEFEWPLARTQWRELFLSSHGGANSAAGNGQLGPAPSGPPDRFDYDPENPVPTLGGAWGFTNVGPRDQSAIEAREDVLVYTSAPLEEAMEVTGPVSVKLYVSSSAPDTHFTAKLVDVRADGRPMSVTDGILCVSHRHGEGEPAFLQPGEVVELTIPCNPTAYLFGKGHRVRLEVASSNFPAFARHLNTEKAATHEARPVVARQTLFHSPEHPSRLILPVIPPSP